MPELFEILKVAGVEGGLIVLGALTVRWLAPRIDKLVQTHCRLMMRMRYESRRKTALLKQMAASLRRASREHRALANAIVLSADEDRRTTVAAATSAIRGAWPPEEPNDAASRKTNSHDKR